MGRKLLAAAAAILALTGGAMALVAWLTRTEPGRGAPAAEAPLPLAEASAAPPVPPPAGLAPGASVAAPAPVDVPLPPPPRESWQAVKAVARVGQLGPLGRELTAGLDELRPRLSRCLDASAQARHAAAPSVGVDATDGGAVPSVMLHLEVAEGQVRIADAPVEERAGADDGLFSCAQAALRGQVLPAPSAHGTSRLRLVLQLAQ